MSNDKLKRTIRFLWLYRLLVPVARLVLRTANGAIHLVSPNPTWFNSGDFPWVKDLENAYPEIRRECLAIIQDLNNVPNLDELSEGSSKLAKGADWKGFLVYAFGKVAPRNALRCPATVAACRNIPGLNTVAFSILAPGVHLPRHTGEFAGIIRFHLGILLPPTPGCRIGVDDEERAWEEGKVLIFDDTHPHEVWNETDYIRVVLLGDCVRPTIWPLRILITFMLWAVGNTTYTRDVIKNAEEYAPKNPAAAVSNPNV